LRLGSIRVWDEMQQHFLKKFFPSHRTNSFKRQITTFTQKPGETFYQCWDRYRDLLNTCPHHGFKTWRLVSHFYEGLTLKDRQMVELMCNGTFKNKDHNEGMEYLDLLAEMLKIGTLQALIRHQIKLNLIHLVEECTTLGKIMTSKTSLHL